MKMSEVHADLALLNHEGITEVDRLPVSVTQFCDNITKNFNQTSSALRTRAENLRRVAEELDQRADRLDKAAPDLRNDIQGWIKYEQDSHIRQQALALVKPV